MNDEPIVLSDVYGQTTFDILKDKTGLVMIIEAYGVPSISAINCFLPNQEDITKSLNVFGIHKEFCRDKPCWIGIEDHNDGGEWVNYQEFIDFMMVEYPEYLEWFLFHSEWL